MELNEVLEKLPKHLLNLVIDQPYNDYTEQDHAVWRYVMRQNVRYLKDVAHHSYLGGLEQTGIGIERIPHMYGMNRILKEIGWAAVAVDGFIPPAAFMEFQAYNVLVIAADIRPIDQIEYTPAPDIIHEAAGHAPIIADPDYAEYLRVFGEIGSKAFSSAKDYEVYEAIRHLSILKADPYTSKADIEKAENELSQLQLGITSMSEMSLIRNLHWWTVEYGLIGSLDKPKIYGAGLLSSIGESYSSLQPEVDKIPYTLDAVHYNFDITTRQPQLFVTPDFNHLTDVLLEYKSQMALEKGGIYGLHKAVDSQNTATVVYSSGLQVSGVFTEYMEHEGSLIYIKATGPTALAFENKQLKNHGKNYHADGFGSPVGKIKNFNVPLESMNESDLLKAGIESGKNTKIDFESGIQVEGRVKEILRLKGKTVLISFADCIVKYEDKILFEPSWGTYDMAVGSEVLSAYNGAADPDAFGYEFPAPNEKTHKIEHSEVAKKLHQLYGSVRKLREEKASLNGQLSEIANEFKTNYKKEWLIGLELLEIVSEKNSNKELMAFLQGHLSELQKTNEDLNRLIANGLKVIR